MTAPEREAGPWLVDGHVHFHPGFDARRFFDAAAGNFARAARELGLRPAGAVLCFTESAGEHRFRAFRDAAGSGDMAAGGWRLERTAEAESLVARRDGGMPLVLVAGRQIVTRDGLEVLALGADLDTPDGLPIDEVIAAVRAGGALPVVPWGFGKWTGRRGALVRRLVESGALREGFLGDNSGRLRFGREPGLFRDAVRDGVFVIPGSDPLPFPAQAANVGRYGFVLDAPLALDRPAASLRDRLRTLRTEPCTFGRLENLPEFLLSQFRMQLRKRRAPRPRSRQAAAR